MNPPASAPARPNQGSSSGLQSQAGDWSAQPQPQRIKRHRTGGDVAKGLGALLVLVVLLGAIPFALIRYIGWPLPHQLPSSHFFNQPITPQVLLNALAVIVWLAWAQFAACVVVEFLAAVRGIGMPARVPAAGPSQFLARQLIAALLMITASAASFVPNLAHLGPHGVPTSAATPPAATAGVLPGGAQHPAIAPHPASHAGATGATGVAGAGSVAGTYTYNHLPAVRGESGLRVASDTTSMLSPDGTKLYRVQPPHGRHHDTLWEIAQRHLGDGRRYKEIYELNKDRVQPDGCKLTNAALIRPGWILMMPADATGGDLVVEMPPTSPQALSPAQSNGVQSGSSDGSNGVQSGSSESGSVDSGTIHSDAPDSGTTHPDGPASTTPSASASSASASTPTATSPSDAAPSQPAASAAAPTAAQSQTASSALKPVPSAAPPPIFARPSTVTQSADELAKLATAAASAANPQTADAQTAGPTTDQPTTAADTSLVPTPDTNHPDAQHPETAQTTPASSSSAVVLAALKQPATVTTAAVLAPANQDTTTTAELPAVRPTRIPAALAAAPPAGQIDVPRPSHRGAHSPEESQPPSTDNRVLYGLAASPLLAAGLLKAIGRHRRRQLWNRVFGRRPVTPSGDGAVAEESIRVGASEVEVWFLDLALRGLSAGLAERGLTVPGAYAARLRDEGIELLLNKPVAPDDPAVQPPAPWFTAADGRSWNFPRPGIVDVDAQAAHRRFAPYPGLVTIGSAVGTAPGSKLGPTLADAANPALAPAVASALGIGIGSADGPTVAATLAGGVSTMSGTTSSPPHTAASDTVANALDALDIPSSIGSNGSTGSDRVMIDLEEARGLIGLDGPAEIRRAVLAAIAVELATNSWSDRMTVTLVGFPGDLTPLAPARVRHVRTLDEILPSLEIEAGERAKALAAAGLESVLDGRSRASQASSFPPHFVLVSEEPHAAILARLSVIGTTAARVGLGFVIAGNPPGATWQLTVNSDRRISAPALGIEARVQLLPEEQYAAVLGLFRAVCDIEGTDVAAKPAHQSVGYGGALPDEPPSVYAALLGPLEVTGVEKIEAVEPERIALLNEALVFLLHHRHGVHPRVLAAALWPRGATADVAEATFARLATWLGTDPHGEPNLHTDPDGRLRLGPYVWSDWDVFVSLQSRALYDASIPDQKQRDDMLKRALDLVRGPYLADREPNRYGWLAYEVAEAQVPAVIADSALQLADSYVASAEPEAAIEAVKAGMRGTPDDEELWRGLLRATSATQDTERLRGAIEGLYKRTWYVHGVQGLHPRTEALVNELMPGWRELVAA